MKPLDPWLATTSSTDAAPILRSTVGRGADLQTARRLRSEPTCELDCLVEEVTVDLLEGVHVRPVLAQRGVPFGGHLPRMHDLQRRAEAVRLCCRDLDGGQRRLRAVDPGDDGHSAVRSPGSPG